jgi:hypothetical protein
MMTMSKYLVTWVEETIFGVMVEADSEKAALDIFEQSKYDMDDVQAMQDLGIQENTIVVEKI